MIKSRSDQLSIIVVLKGRIGMQCYRGLRLGQGFRSRNRAFPSSTPPMESFQSRGQQLCKFIGTKESFNIRIEEFNSHRIGSEQQHDPQCGSHCAPGSEIVGTARLRKRDHENQTGGSHLFPDHVVKFFACLSLALHRRDYLRAWNRLPMRQTFLKVNTLYIYN